YYRDEVLPDLVRAYQAIWVRYMKFGGAGGFPGDLNVGDVVVAQQNLATSLATYITTLGQMWQAVVDVTDLLHTPDLFGGEGPKPEVAEIPALEKPVPRPCCHPCSPLPNLHHRVLDGDWPPAVPTTSSPAAPNNAPPPAPPKVLPPPNPLDRNEKAPVPK